MANGCSLVEEGVATIPRIIRLIIKEYIVGGGLIRNFYSFCLTLSLFISIYFVQNKKTQPSEEFYKDAKIENVDKVIIQDGSLS